MMDIPTKVLVAYATDKGSTRGVAEYLADKLRWAELDVDVRTMATMPNPRGYEAVVLGSAVHNRAWLPEAQDYLRAYGADLRAKDVWMFSVDMAEALRGPLGRRMKSAVPPAIAHLRAAVAPRGYASFAGVIDRESMSLWARLAYLAIGGGRYGDLRDWNAITAWATEISDALPHWQPFEVKARRRADVGAE